MKRLVVMLAVLAAVSYVGCKQGDGDRCQVNEDCESGVCNKAKGTCASSGSATTEIDAPTIPDGPPADAAPDAP